MWRRLFYHPEVNYALRQTCVLATPVAIALLFNQLQIGFLVTLAAICCNVAGLDTPHDRFIKRLVIGAILFSLSSFLLQQGLQHHYPLPIIMLGLALLFGVMGELSPLHARYLTAALLAAIFSLSLYGQYPSYVSPLVYVLGTIWYGFITFYWFKLCKEQPIRENISLLYRQLADYFIAKYQLLVQHTAPDNALPPLLRRQQAIMDTIALLYQQMHWLARSKNPQYRRLLRAFQVALDIQEHVTVSLHQPEEVQKLIEQSQAEAIIRHNANVITQRLQTIADDILYHRRSQPFNMEKDLSALAKLATRHADNPVGQFCFYHFKRIATLLHTQRPSFKRQLMPSQPRIAFWQAIKNYCSLSSVALRNAARIGTILAIGSTIGTVFHLQRGYWILLTIIVVLQNGYNATRIRVQHRAVGTFVGLILAAALLSLQPSRLVTLDIMLGLTFFSFFTLRKNYGIAVMGFTIIAVCLLQLLLNHGTSFLVPRMVDTFIGCVLAFFGTIWLWPQWQSGILLKEASKTLACYQEELVLLLTEKAANHDTAISYARMRSSQTQNTLLSAFHQAMQEPGFDSRYLAEMRLWITHSQFIVEHLNAMTILVRDGQLLENNLAEHYLHACQTALHACQQRLTQDGPSDHLLLEETNKQITTFSNQGPMALPERHLQRVLAHLSTMYTISSIAWQQRPNKALLSFLGFQTKAKP